MGLLVATLLQKGAIIVHRGERVDQLYFEKIIFYEMGCLGLQVTILLQKQTVVVQRGNGVDQLYS